MSFIIEKLLQLHLNYILLIIKNTISEFVLLVFLSIMSLIITNNFLEIKELIYNLYSEQLAKEQVDKIFESNKKWEWLTYAFIPVIILVRSLLVSVCLSVGNFFYDMEEKTPFKEFFRIALAGEFVLVLVGYFKFAYFYFIKTDYTLQDLQQYYPLSYTNFLDLEKVAPWLHYPLQTINLFEIAYFFVLVYGMHKLLKNKYSKDFEITAVSYGSGLLIWMGFVMFLTLNYT